MDHVRFSTEPVKYNRYVSRAVDSIILFSARRHDGGDSVSVRHSSLFIAAAFNQSCRFFANNVCQTGAVGGSRHDAAAKLDGDGASNRPLHPFGCCLLKTGTLP